MARRRQYSIGFKIEAVEKYIANENNRYRTARDLEIPENTLQKWLDKYLVDVLSGTRIDEYEEYKQSQIDDILRNEEYAYKMEKRAEEVMKDTETAQSMVNAKSLLLIETLIEKISLAIPKLKIDSTKDMQEAAALIRSLNDIVKSNANNETGESKEGQSIQSIVEKLKTSYEKKTGQKVNLNN